jgi:hypothetical protein
LRVVVGHYARRNIAKSARQPSIVVWRCGLRIPLLCQGPEFLGFALGRLWGLFKGRNLITWPRKFKIGGFAVSSADFWYGVKRALFKEVSIGQVGSDGSGQFDLLKEIGLSRVRSGSDRVNLYVVFF